MPSALLKECAYPGGCAELVVGTFCAEHEKRKEQARVQQRAESHGACDYNGTAWRKFRVWFRSLLIASGITVACGARLPGAPVTQDSQCQANGVIYGDAEHRARTGRMLHADHIDPHRGDVAKFFDKFNIQLLCEECHNRKSQREGCVTA